uniref:SUEL-type lectin domain-containing protein n=1 Tax=Arcella intermedia TaxID=1963864 RepID=A0A6B2L0Y4_9EUKA
MDPDVSPVADRIFDLLAQLGADYVRYVPWFPYPKVGVAELDPPSGGAASWDFADIEPQLRRFMRATSGHPVVPNFSTQPTWMFSPSSYSYPANPTSVDWGYPRGTAGQYPNTTQLVADYYGRLLSWLIKGHLIDEFGVVHYNLGETYNITLWEVFNEVESEHSFSPPLYTSMYDAVVKSIRSAVSPHEIDFVGLALATRDVDWIEYFLDPLNHDPSALPINYISFHFYASCSSRTDPSSYEEFFPAADSFFLEAQAIAALRDTKSPHTKLSCDELGVILPNDNDANAPPFPRVYWNAAGALYAYVFGHLVTYGYDILGESQLAGVPAVPEWGIVDAQYPSVSLVNWTNGDGNARFWTLDLLIKHFAAGDNFVKSSVNIPPESVFCADLPVSIGVASLYCADSSAVINDIQFAAYGTPQGECTKYTRGACDAPNATQYIKEQCIGKNSCSVVSYPTFGDPCYGTEKRLVIQATCSGGAGGNGLPGEKEEVYAQGVVDGKTGAKKVLLVNKKSTVSCVNLPGANGAISYTIDQKTEDGPARKDQLSSEQITLDPFAVSVIYLN